MIMSLPTRTLIKNIKTDQPKPYHEGLVSPENLERILDKSIDFDSVQDLFTQGFVLAQQGDLRKAILVWDEVLDVEPEFISALYNQGVAYFELEELENARQKFEHSLQLDFNYIPARLNLGVTFIELKQYSRAISNLKIVIQQNPDLPQAWHNYGFALYQLNQLEAAIEKYNKALSLDNSRYLPHYCKGKALFFLDRFDEAIDSYSAALRIQPNTPMALLSRGMVFLRDGRPKDAISDFDKVIELDPSIIDFQVFYEKSIALSELGEFQEALENINKFLQRDSNLVGQAYHLQGALLIHLDRKMEAFESFDKALEFLDPNTDEIWFYKPSIYVYKGQIDQAFDCLQDLVNNNPRLFLEILNKGGFDNLKNDQRLDDLKIKAEDKIKEILKEQGEILARIEYRRKTDPARHGLPDPTQIIREARDRPTTTNYLLDPVALDDRIRAEGQVLLQGISWDEFEQILEGLGDKRPYRLAYDNGTLEIIMPTVKHEFNKETFSDLIKELAYYLELNCSPMGSTTWKRKDLLKGAEPDNCFYVQNEPAIRNIKPDIDLSKAPPPDLIFEVDHTSPSVKKLPIYAALGVPEVWIYRMGKKKEKLDIYRLQDGDYKKVETSVVFAGFPAIDLPGFVAANIKLSPLQVRRNFNAWLDQVFAQPAT
jgi:tetratricopeptide (TPR) repeat protein/Uma2 family endonuclease